jgi:hypothetical protein
MLHRAGTMSMNLNHYNCGHMGSFLFDSINRSTVINCSKYCLLYHSEIVQNTLSVLYYLILVDHNFSCGVILYLLFY